MTGTKGKLRLDNHSFQLIIFIIIQAIIITLIIIDKEPLVVLL